MPYTVDLAEDGLQYEVVLTRYGSVVVLTAFTYDWILAITAEVASVQKTRLNLPIVAYYLSRICSIAYCISLFLVKLTIIVDTEQIEILKFAIWWAASASTSLLFFFRVSAVYKHSRPIRFLFSLLWIIIIVSPTAIIYSLRTQCREHPDTDCNSSRFLSLIANGTICINDTLVFVLVSCQVYNNSATRYRGNWIHRIGQFLRGKGLYNISRSVLQSGQLYYGVTIGFQLSSTITYAMNTRYTELVGVSYIALSSSMACRVFRMVLLCNTAVDAPNTEDIARVLRFASEEEDIDALGRERGDLIPLT
ncbi:hypothetical protein FIBSPDRAFT_853335 [Athelia psychrophila]|uniref:Transmembrane protein n=1 Tax=Athelia psychrophila TaxID=1759441 RepID=A0A166R1Y9_9AGAM|nr:hypothetical protein FIBSPDRAFT_858509 [Fibularhizoctonia sp. CBS 109695]KZP27809.1 hypothetical protein FIBSPDRAFT_853335 [Fibularhizoctonia sp. CBS 109695]